MESDRVERLRYFMSLHKVAIQHTPEYTLYACFAPSPRPGLPDRVAMKQWTPPKPGTRQSDSEITLIQEISKEYRNSLPVPQYLGHFIQNRALVLFTTELDKSLHEEIMDRRRNHQPWSELGLWHHLERLSRLIYYLHTLRIVHRNISPDTLFLKGGELYLFHFDDCKRLGPNDTVQDATIRGAVNFLSPQAEAARAGELTLTYEVSRKDDVWGLGRTLLDMTSLALNQTLKTHYHRSQPEFEQHITSLIGESYSNVLKAAIRGLLILEAAQRPDFETFYEWVKQVYHSQPCGNCGNQVEMVWPCNHVLCFSCLHLKAVSVLLAPASTNLRICSCSRTIPADFISLLPEKTQKIAKLLLNPERNCPRNCRAKYNMLIERNCKMQPYYFRCPNCLLGHCSLCDAPSEHRTLGISRMCPEFAKIIG